MVPLILDIQLPSLKGYSKAFANPTSYNLSPLLPVYLQLLNVIMPGNEESCLARSMLSPPSCCDHEAEHLVSLHQPAKFVHDESQALSIHPHHHIAYVEQRIAVNVCVQPLQGMVERARNALFVNKSFDSQVALGFGPVVSYGHHFHMFDAINDRIQRMEQVISVAKPP